MNINFYKKLMTRTVLMGVLLSLFVFPIKSNVVFAQAAAAAIGAVPTTDIPLTTLTAAKNTKDATEKLTTTLRQFAVMLVKKLIINRIVDMTAQWIQRGGFEGKGGPIVQDWNAFFKQAEEDALGELANKYVKVLCTPFKLNAALFLTPPASTLSTKVSCTLDAVVSNVDDFFKDFEKSSNGRWIAYNTIWEPQNNYFGTILNLEDEKETKLSDVKNQQNVKATVNLGFQPQVKCTKDTQTGKDHCVTITPGQTIATKLVGPATGELQTNSLLASSDISNYVAVLADAIIYRYQMLAVSGLQGMLAAKDKTEKENTDLCNRCLANPNTSECLTASCINQDLQSRFNMIDSLTFNNSRSLYMDDINSMLTAKSSTDLALKNSRSSEAEFSVIYENLNTCNLGIIALNDDNNSTNDVLVTSDQAEILRNASSVKANIDAIITDLDNRVGQVESQLNALKGVQAQFNAYTSDQTSTMEANYANLIANGVINLTAANSQLADAQTEAAGYSQALETQKTTNADAGGFQDVRALCVPILLNPTL